MLTNEENMNGLFSWLLEIQKCTNNHDCCVVQVEG